MEFRVFGRIQVLDGDVPVDLGPRMHRAVLAILLLDANRVVPTERLIDQLWDGAPPPAAGGALHAYISNLRRALEPDRAPRTPPAVLLTEPPGYLLRVAPDAFDAARFEALVAVGRGALAAGRPAPARDALAAALALSEGPPYAELASEAWMRAEVTRLGELRAGAGEDLAAARLALGEHTVAVAELEGLVAAEPLRERGWELLALALYRSGRQADALRALASIRSVLAEELGLEPRPSLQKLEGDILRHDPSLELAPVAVAAPEEDGYLEVWSTSGRQLVTLAPDRVTIGRSSECSIQVPDLTVSRTHAVIERTGAGWVVRDAGSANGTSVNGTPLAVDAHPLQPGDEIAVGPARLFFRSRAAEAVAETVGRAP